MKKKIVPITLFIITTFILACGYDYDPVTGRTEHDYEDDYFDALDYVSSNYTIGEVFDEESIIEYVTAKYSPTDLYDFNQYYPTDIYDIDTLIETLEDSGYSVIMDEVQNENEVATEFFYIGNMNTNVYHRPSCNSVKQMSNKNTIRRSKEELEKAGYKPCQNCNP